MDAETAETRRLPFALRAALIGTGIAAAAVAGSLLLGATPAHAADSSPGLLGVVSEVTDAADSTTSEVGALLNSSPVSAIAAPVTTTVDTIVVETVTAVPVARPIVAEVVGEAPTTSIVAPVFGLLDETLGAAGEVIADAGGVLDDLPTPLPPTTVPVDSVPGTFVYGPSATAALVSADTAASLQGLSSADDTLAVSGNASSVATPVVSTVATRPAVPGGPVSPGGANDPAVVAGTSGAGSTATSPAAPAAELDGRAPSIFLFTGIRALPGDDDVPASAVYDTDSSPD